MKNLKWIGRLNAKGGNDVSIACNIMADGKRHYAGFTFRNESYELFAENAEYFVIAFEGNRMYFKGSDKHHGLSLMKNCHVSPSIRYGKMQNTFAKKLLPWVGDYSLEYDKEEKLYYIEREDKK